MLTFTTQINTIQSEITRKLLQPVYHSNAKKMRFSLQGKGKMKCDQLQWLQCSLRLAGATSIGGRVAPDNSWEGQEGRGGGTGGQERRGSCPNIIQRRGVLHSGFLASTFLCSSFTFSLCLQFFIREWIEGNKVQNFCFVKS